MKNALIALLLVLPCQAFGQSESREAEGDAPAAVTESPEPVRELTRLRIRFIDGERSRDSNARETTVEVTGGTLEYSLHRTGRQRPGRPSDESCSVSITDEQFDVIQARVSEGGLWRSLTEVSSTSETGDYQRGHLVLEGPDGPIESRVEGMTQIWGRDTGNVTETDYLAAMASLASHLSSLASCD